MGLADLESLDLSSQAWMPSRAHTTPRPLIGPDGVRPIAAARSAPEDGGGSRWISARGALTLGEGASRS